ncbi:hypothetical protein [Amphritea japonica]|uniref:Uncharacterized protein n=1 Tax=Amphritea japonica ATCC BAA-1530 TaxID=1278309 RepID=A0A7R6ST08_9GAMM|nr:hypothetical protein [Amphritea japonica]BBB26132.1 conserved hypothetical protein [Amphritea japonica ATCC BAA-1530]
MNIAIALLQRASKGKTVLALFVLTNLIYGVILGYSIPLVLSFSPDSILFDMSPAGYSYEQAVDLLQSLRAEGRNAYLSVQIPLDFVYPGMFAVSYTLLFTWILKQYLPLGSTLFALSFIPLLAGAFDYLENLGIILMLNEYPDVSEIVVSISSGFTIAKSGFTTIFFVLLIIALAVLIVRKVRKNSAVS